MGTGPGPWLKKWKNNMDRFKLEQNIMECERIIDDLETLGKKRNISKEDMVFTLKTLYSARFDKLFDVFEECVRNRKI